jgi:hypothetical protein
MTLTIATTSEIRRCDANTDPFMDTRGIVDQERLDRTVSTIRQLVSTFGHHAWDCDVGEHIIKIVCLDESMHVKALPAVARDDPRGGRLITRKVKDLKAFLAATHSTMPVEDMGHEPASVYCAPLDGGRAILAFHPRAASALLAARLGFLRAIEFKLSDGKGLGKSTPRMSERQFAFLCPTAPENSRKKGAAFRAPFKRRRSEYDTVTQFLSLCTIIDDAPRERALKVLAAFNQHGTEYMQDVMAALAVLPVDAVGILLTDPRAWKSLAKNIPVAEDGGDTMLEDDLCQYIDSVFASTETM